MPSMFGTLLILTFVIWATVRLKRHHERLMTELHASLNEEIKDLRAELAGVRLVQQRERNGR